MNAKTCLFALASLFAANALHAQEPNQPPPAAFGAAPVADATYRALRDRVVALRLRDGSEVIGQVIADDSAVVTLALAPSRRVCTVAKYDVVDVRLADAAPASSSAPIASQPGAPVEAGESPNLTLTAPAPERERHFGLNFGFSPSVDLDVDAGMFHGFLNANLVLPMASDGQLLAFGIGGGVSFHVRPRSHWRLDVFAAVTPVRWSNGSDWAVGMGVGLGAHYTMNNGFTIGFKTPVLGYSVGSQGLTGSSGSATAMYYLTGVMGLPVVSIGYRF
ncbi:MAG TPA: hypothetical protein VFF06_11435 [Polyangia bacterium]|nr:hypothetical protein [Polyangia bacterium]